MTLYTNVESNIRKTWLYLTGFFVVVIGVGWFFGSYLRNPDILVFAVVLSIAMSVGSYWFSDKVAIAMTGARAVSKQDAPELYRIVENLSITAGLPMPALYIVPDAQPNAFATGRDPKHAALAVTAGLLERLDRAELEGVVAHELSHIGNRDILLSTIVVVLVGIIALVSDFFLRMSLWGGRRDRREGNAGVILLIIGIAAAILAPLVAQLIQLGISRKREFLADASGALLTRYPDGLARALEKISAFPHSMRSSSNATAHLFIASPLRGKESASWIAKLFMTHPPAAERVAALRNMSA
ncbi:MAG: M48 family metallopeptidase [Candidatus Wildermuthbacteria bacterium]|nr:M48 family metallopeptidase [Candidatus Wildermuthbacteria bacterium]